MNVSENDPKFQKAVHIELILKREGGQYTLHEWKDLTMKLIDFINKDQGDDVKISITAMEVSL